MNLEAFNENANTILRGLSTPSILDRLSLECSRLAADAALYSRLMRDEDPCPECVDDSMMRSKISADIASVMNAMSITECSIFEPEEISAIVLKQAQKMSGWAGGVKSKNR